MKGHHFLPQHRRNRLLIQNYGLKLSDQLKQIPQTRGQNRLTFKRTTLLHTMSAFKLC